MNGADGRPGASATRRRAASGGRNGRSGQAIRHGGSPRVTWGDAPADRFEAFRDLASRAALVDDVVRFAEEAAERVRRDHDSFRRDHALGAFESVEVAHR